MFGWKRASQQPHYHWQKIFVAEFLRHPTDFLRLVGRQFLVLHSSFHSFRIPAHLHTNTCILIQGAAENDTPLYLLTRCLQKVDLVLVVVVVTKFKKHRFRPIEVVNH